MNKKREIETCLDMADVRRNIDRLDAEIVTLLAERAGYVAQAAQIKKSIDTVRIPARVEQVIENVRHFALANNLEPEIAEAAYRPLVEAYIQFETRKFKQNALIKDQMP